MDAAVWDARHAAHRSRPDQEPCPGIAEALAGRPPGSALDLACGQGRHALWLAEQGWDVTGVDFSAVALRRAAAAAVRRGVAVSWVEADLRTWRPPTAVDLVLVAYLHLPADQRRRVLRTAAAAVRPHGTLLVVGHDRATLALGGAGPRDPALLYDAHDVVADVAGLGLHAVRAREMALPARDGEPSSVDVLVELRRDPAAPHDAAPDDAAPTGSREGWLAARRPGTCAPASTHPVPATVGESPRTARG